MYRQTNHSKEMNKFIRTIFPIVLITAFFFNSSYGQDHAYTLEKCILIAYQNNLNIQRGKLDNQEYEIILEQARMSRLPDLNVGGSYSSNWGRSIDPTTNLFENQKINSVGLNGSSNMMLFNGFAISNSIKQAIVDWQTGKASFEKTQNDVALTVANLYLNVIFNQELKKNADLQLNSSQEQLDRTQKLVDAGALPITNLLEIQSQFATNEVNVINRENDYNLAILQLKQALQIPASDPFEIVIPDLEVGDMNDMSQLPNDIYAIAETNQPQIKVVELRVKSADLGVKISRSSYLPSLSVGAGFRTNYSGIANVPRVFYEGTSTIDAPIGYLQSDPNELVYTTIDIRNEVGSDPNFTLSEQFSENLSRFVGLNLSIPIFNRMRTRSDVQRSIIMRQRAELDAVEIRNSLRQDIETAYNSFVAALRSYNATDRQVSALEETFRVVENQYNLGAVNFVDYQVAANNLYMARSDKLRAKYDLIFKRKVLDFYLGKPLSF